MCFPSVISNVVLCPFSNGLDGVLFQFFSSSEKAENSVSSLGHTA